MPGKLNFTTHRALGGLATAVASVVIWNSPPASSAPAFVFEDGFENATVYLDVLKADASRWTHFQKTLPENRIEISTKRFASGGASVQFYTRPSLSLVSKADLERQLDAGAGDLVSIAASFFIPGGQSLRDVFLLDLECQSCWPASSPFPNKSPGIRVQLKGPGGVPVVERGKIGLKSYRDPEASPQPMPRGRWTRLEWRLKLSTDESGIAEIVIDGMTVFRGAGPNVPDPKVFETWGIQLSRSAYDRMQIGITANGSGNPVEIFVDDVKVTVERPG